MKNVILFPHDKNKVFCRVRKLNNVVKFCEYRKPRRLYYRVGARLFPAYQTLGGLRDLVNAGNLYIWTGNKG